MNKTEKLLLEAIKACASKMSEMSDSIWMFDNSIEDIRFTFEEKEYVVSVKTAGMPKFSDEPIAESAKLEKAVINALHKVGVPAHLMGYTYLKDAIKLVVIDPDMLRGITKGLYVDVAKMNGTTVHKLERAMRHAVDATYRRHRTETLESLFGDRVNSPSCRISNSEFISKISEVLRMGWEE